MWQYTYTDELYQSGILGMKWGVRRYQNPDGSLTAAGKIRYRTKDRFEAVKNEKAAKLQREYNDLTGHSIRKSAKNEAKEEQTKPKTISEMSNEEIQARINRINLEKTYTQAIASLNPQKVSRGQKFVESFKDQAVNTISKGAAEAVGDVAKAALTKALKSSLGLADSSKNNQNKKVGKDKKE